MRADRLGMGKHHCDGAESEVQGLEAINLTHKALSGIFT
jgi:hypothetical protein